MGRSEFGLSYDIDYYDDPETGGNEPARNLRRLVEKTSTVPNCLGLAYNPAMTGPAARTNT